MIERYEAIVSAELEGIRLDACIARMLPAISRSRARQVLDFGGVNLNGKRTHVASRRVHAGDQVSVTYDPELLEAPEPDPLRILYADDVLLIVAKPPGLLSQGTTLGDRRTVIFRATRYLRDRVRSGHPWPKSSICLHHRLDREASGLLLLTTRRDAHREMARQFKRRKVIKEYHVWVQGYVQQDPGEITCPLRRSGRRMVVDERSHLEALTRYRVVSRTEEASLLLVRAVTGRTHQIRVHLSHLGHPVMGDRRYRATAERDKSARLMLHACRLGFTHPTRRHRMEFRLALPPDFRLPPK